MKPNFRAWIKSLEVMAEVLVINFEEETVILKGHERNTWANFSQVILMQHTGLKDKNGVEIFGGDIVELEGHVKAYRGVIKDSVGLYRFEELIGANAKDYGEVIGNIYENPELMNEINR